MRKVRLTLLADREETPPPAAEKLAYSIAAVAGMTSLSIRHLRRLDCHGDIPGRFTVGRRVLFKADVIRKWVANGMPDKQTFALIEKRATK